MCMSTPDLLEVTWTNNFPRDNLPRLFPQTVRRYTQYGHCVNNERKTQLLMAPPSSPGSFVSCHNMSIQPNLQQHCAHYHHRHRIFPLLQTPDRSTHSCLKPRRRSYLEPGNADPQRRSLHGRTPTRSGRDVNSFLECGAISEKRTREAKVGEV